VRKTLLKSVFVLKYKMVSFKTLLLLVLCAENILTKKSPVVIVPGTGGSQLEGKLVNKPTKSWYCYSSTSSYFTLWLQISSLSNALSLNCWIDNFKLVWDMKSMTASNSEGVLTRTQGWGDTSTIETLDTNGLVKYTRPMIDYLVSIGYVKGKDLRGAPYDFRYSPEYIPDNFHDKLKNLIEETYTMNGDSKVSLLSHSYGCPVTLYFLSLQTKAWKDLYLKQWIALSGIFGGTIQEVLVYVSGYLEGIPSFIVDKKLIRYEQRLSTSNLFMLPSLELWSADQEILETRDKKYKLSDMDALLTDIGFPEGAKMRHHIVNTSSLMQTSPGVPIHCIYGNIPNSTVKKLIYDDDFPDNPEGMVNGDGDGTVNKESLELCNRFKSKQSESVDVMVVDGVNHNGVFADPSVMQKLSQLL